MKPINMKVESVPIVSITSSVDINLRRPLSERNIMATEMHVPSHRDRLERDIKNRFSYHPPKGSQTARYVEIRDRAGALAMHLADSCPESRELSTALTKLDEVVMWANASIARNE